MKPVLLLSLAIIGAGLLATIGLELGSARVDPESPSSVAARTSAPMAAPADAPGNAAAARAEQMQTVLARPLFSPNRRPPSVAAVATPGAPVATLPRMTAILIDGDRRSAIFAASAGGKASVIVEGGHLGPFTVQTIEPQQVTVVGPDGKRTLRTSFDPHPPPPIATIQPSMAPIIGPLPGQPPGGPPGLAPAASGVAR